MADESSTIATASQASTAQGAETTQPPGTETQQPQAAQGRTPAPDLEKELQKLRSQMGREVAEAKRRAEAAERQAQAIAQRDREQRLNGMDDLERAQFERQEAINYAESVRQQSLAAQQAAQRERDIAELCAEYGAPREIFDEATDYADAIKRARAYEKAQRAAQVEEEVEKRTRKVEANLPDLGGGKPSTAASRHDDELKAAWKQKDAKSYVLGILNSR